MAKNKLQWPIRVEARTYDERGRVLKLSRTVEGAGNAETAMLAAVVAHPRRWGFLGCEIVGITPLGQTISRVLDIAWGEYVLVK